MAIYAYLLSQGQLPFPRPQVRPSIGVVPTSGGQVSSSGSIAVAKAGASPTLRSNIPQIPLGSGGRGTGAGTHTNTGCIVGGPPRSSVITVATNTVSPAATVAVLTVGVNSSSPTPMRIQHPTQVRPMEGLKPGLTPSTTAVPGEADLEKGTPKPTGVVTAAAGAVGPGARLKTPVALASRVGVAEDHSRGHIGLHRGGSGPPTAGGAVPPRGLVARATTTPALLVVSPSEEEVREQHDNDDLV